ncbi:SEC10/PgrA surface exclusion domain-containing protein, partial [Streptococcus porci]
NDTRYLGIDLSSRSDANSVHFLLVGDEDLVSESTFDKTAIANNSTIEKLQEVYQKAKDSLVKAEEANKKAQETLALKQAEKGTAEATAKTAQESLEKALATPVQTPLAEKAVTLAKGKVIASNGVYQKAQEALKTLKADVKQKQANVEAANAYLKAKEVELEALQQLLSADKKVLEQAKLAKSEATLKVKKAENTLSELKEKLAEANNDLKVLLNAPAVLKDAQAILKLSVSRLEDKKSALAAATSRLEELKAIEKEATNHYKVVLNAYQKVQEAKRQEQLEKERKEEINSNKTTVPITYNTGKVLGGVALASQVSPVTKSTDEPISQAKADLPATGDSESALGLLGFVLTLMSTFGLVKSKKQSH